MHDCQIQPPYCDLNSGGAVDPNTGNCGEKEMSPILFAVVMLVINYMLLNLLIAVILDNFMETQSMSESKVTDEHFASFDEAWGMYDFNGDGFIESSLVPNLITRVLYPLGLKNIPLTNMHGATIRKRAKTMTVALNCKVIQGMVAFAALRTALNAYAMGDMELPEDVSMVQDFKKLHSKKAGAEIQRKIETKVSDAKKKAKKKSLSSFGTATPQQRNRKSNAGWKTSPTTPESDDVLIRQGEDDAVSEFDTKTYTLSHVVAVVSTQALSRGMRTRSILKRWRSLASHAKLDTQVHPMLRTRHMLTNSNYDQLKKGVGSIKQTAKLGKLAERARLNLKLKKLST